MLYELQGKYDAAEPLYQQLLELQKRLAGEGSSRYATSLNNLAGLYLAQAMHSHAEPLYRRSLEITRERLGEEHPDFGLVLNNYAMLHHDQGAFAAAEPLYRRSVEIARNNIQRYALIQTEQQQRAYQRSVEHRLMSYHANAMLANQFGQTAFELALSWKGASQLRQKEQRELASDSEVAEIFQRLRRVSQKLYRHLKQDTSSETWKSQFDLISEEKEQIEKELAALSSAFRKIKQDVTLDQVLSALPKDAVLIDFHEYRIDANSKAGYQSSIDKLFAFVIRHDHSVEMIDLGERESIYSAIREWRVPMDAKNGGSAARAKAADAGKHLRERLWLPLEKRFGGFKTVLLSPVGELGTLPFTALPGTEPDHFLIEEYRIATIPVPRLLAQIGQDVGATPAGDLLLLGDVDYKSAPQIAVATKKKRKRRHRGAGEVLRGTQFDELGETAGEIATIKELFFDSFDSQPDAVRTLKRSEASEALLTQYAPQYQMLHIATHGFFAAPEHTAYTNVKVANEDLVSQIDSARTTRSSIELRNAFHPGLLSGLALAGANLAQQENSSDDGIVTAEEISFLPLSGVDLVTLSACETGLGKSAGGEGLIGLQRAFQIAGARTVVASLWKVDDTATRRLMERFYRNLFEKDMSKLDAIIEAQRWAINNPQSIRGSLDLGEQNQAPKRSDPRLWAAWTLSGDWK